jgi:prevent-host-death family protein
MKPHRTGVREAKAHLSRLLRGVERGQEWIITDRGKPVARLVPASGDDLPLTERIHRLEAAGLIEPLNRETGDLPSPLPLKRGLAQTWLQEDRNE